jgi:hypothetical protein
MIYFSLMVYYPTLFELCKRASPEYVNVHNTLTRVCHNPIPSRSCSNGATLLRTCTIICINISAKSSGCFSKKSAFQEKSQFHAFRVFAHRLVTQTQMRQMGGKYATHIFCVSFGRNFSQKNNQKSCWFPCWQLIHIYIILSIMQL